MITTEEIEHIFHALSDRDVGVHAGDIEGEERRVEREGGVF